MADEKEEERQNGDFCGGISRLNKRLIGELRG